MRKVRLRQWLEALPIVIAEAAVVLFGPSLALSTTLGFVGVAVYALLRGRCCGQWHWASSNVPLARAAAYIIIAALAD